MTMIQRLTDAFPETFQWIFQQAIKMTVNGDNLVKISYKNKVRRIFQGYLGHQTLQTLLCSQIFAVKSYTQQCQGV